jgi:hypothetical protein
MAETGMKEEGRCYEYEFLWVVGGENWSFRLSNDLQKVEMRNPPVGAAQERCWNKGPGVASAPRPMPGGTVVWVNK